MFVLDSTLSYRPRTAPGTADGQVSFILRCVFEFNFSLYSGEPYIGNYHWYTENVIFMRCQSEVYFYPLPLREGGFYSRRYFVTFFCGHKNTKTSGQFFFEILKPHS